MQIRFTKSRWEYGQVSFETYLDRVGADGFDGAEVFLFPEKLEPSHIREAIQKRDLFLIAQLISSGKTVNQHRHSMDEQVLRAKACGALFVNCHSGSDFFTFEDNLRIFQHSAELSKACGLSFYHETHRGRALYSLPETLRYLDARPSLEITADFSHFMCVHESDLQEQEPLLDRVIARTRHIHARVGFPEGPQVAHPLAPEWSALLERYLGWWKKMLVVMERAGAPFACITPEAGPPGYMPVVPYTNQPLADAWTVNVQVKDWLKSKLP